MLAAMSANRHADDRPHRSGTHTFPCFKAAQFTCEPSGPLVLLRAGFEINLESRTHPHGSIDYILPLPSAPSSPITFSVLPCPIHATRTLRMAPRQPELELEPKGARRPALRGVGGVCAAAELAPDVQESNIKMVSAIKNAKNYCKL
jgi:hypothetical protein